MSATTIQKCTTTDGIQFERWPARRSIDHGRDHSPVHIVGVGDVGGGLTAGLYYRLGVDDGITFQQVAATNGALSDDGQFVAAHLPFEGANVVIVIAATGELDALRVSAVVGAAAERPVHSSLRCWLNRQCLREILFEPSRLNSRATPTLSCLFPNLLTLPFCIVWSTST